MTKRAGGKFGREEDDFYPTPELAVRPLLPHLHPKTRFYEPCAGDGSLSRILVNCGHVCMGMSDIRPKAPEVKTINALRLEKTPPIDRIITNPPWKRDLMHMLMENLPLIAPTWLLIETDWLFTKQAHPLWRKINKIVAIGRVRWIPGSASDGFDNCCWVLMLDQETSTTFYGRQASTLDSAKHKNLEIAKIRNLENKGAGSAARASSPKT